jgi:hypothetical protein
MKPARSMFVALAVAGSLGAVLGGCVTETRSSAPSRNRSSVSRPARPSGIEPQQMVLTAGVASDADGNGYPDTIPVTIFMFGDLRRYELPLSVDGEFEFELMTQDARPLARWVFPEDETANSLRDSPTGVCYRFALRLAPGRDRIPVTAVGLRAIFTNEKTGQRVTSTGAASVRLGAGG